MIVRMLYGPLSGLSVDIPDGLDSYRVPVPGADALEVTYRPEPRYPDGPWRAVRDQGFDAWCEAYRTYRRQSLNPEDRSLQAFLDRYYSPSRQPAPEGTPDLAALYTASKAAEVLITYNPLLPRPVWRIHPQDRDHFLTRTSRPAVGSEAETLFGIDVIVDETVTYPTLCMEIRERSA
ncbi:MAG: hypothetical protein REI11_18975 [Patulibacter sp.]|nr:hypothetical protein [Patulibacter sp.]